MVHSVEAIPTNCTNDVVTAVFELPTSPFALSKYGMVSADRVDFSSFACFKRTIEQIDFTPFLCYRD